MTVSAGSAAFDFGRVISRLFGVLSRNIVTFLLLSVLLVGLPSALLRFIQLSAMVPLISAGQPGDPSAAFADMFSPVRVVLWLASLLIAMIGNATLQGAVIYASVSDLSGRKATFGDCLATGFRFFLPLVAIGLLVGIGCFFGLIFFIIPGVILALSWCVATPAEVMERTGVFGSLGRSYALTEGHRFAILGLSVIYIVAALIVQTVIGSSLTLGIGAASLGAGAQAFSLNMVAQAIVSLLMTTILGSIGSAGIASIYFELRQAKEGVGVEQLASVFD